MHPKAKSDYFSLFFNVNKKNRSAEEKKTGGVLRGGEVRKVKKKTGNSYLTLLHKARSKYQTGNNKIKRKKTQYTGYRPVTSRLRYL